MMIYENSKKKKKRTGILTQVINLKKILVYDEELIYINYDEMI